MWKTINSCLFRSLSWDGRTVSPLAVPGSGAANSPTMVRLNKSITWPEIEPGEGGPRLSWIWIKKRPKCNISGCRPPLIHAFSLSSWVSGLSEETTATCTAWGEHQRGQKSWDVGTLQALVIQTTHILQMKKETCGDNSQEVSHVKVSKRFLVLNRVPMKWTDEVFEWAETHSLFTVTCWGGDLWGKQRGSMWTVEPVQQTIDSIS